MEDLECGICLENFSNVGSSVPKLLDCDHSICRKCLDEMSKDEQIVVCPFCREETFSPASVPNDETKLSVIKLIEETETETRQQGRNRPPNCPVPSPIIPDDFVKEDEMVRAEMEATGFTSLPGHHLHPQANPSEERYLYSRATAPPWTYPSSSQAKEECILDSFREEDEKARKELEAASATIGRTWQHEQAAEDFGENAPLITRQPEHRIQTTNRTDRRCSCSRYCVICSTVIIIVLTAVFIFGICEAFRD